MSLETYYNPEHTRRVVVDFDPEPLNPRTEQDNVATMWCEHNRYNLGDKEAKSELIDQIMEQARKQGLNLEDEYLDCPVCQGASPNNCLQCDEDGDIENPHFIYLDSTADLLWGLEKVDPDEEHIFRQELYLYEHSGITMSCAPFVSQWDSGQVGIIFVSRKRLLEGGWMGAHSGMETSDIRKLAHQGMKLEVEEYDRYLTGQVFMFRIQVLEHLRMKPGESPGDFDDVPFMWDTVDNCGGLSDDSIETLVSLIPEEDEVWLRG